MRDAAIRMAYPNVITINSEKEAWDKDGNSIVLDEAKIKVELDKLETEWKAKKYQRDRKYPEIGEQLDKLFHDIDQGKLDKNGGFFKALKAVKDANPKP